MLHEKINNLNFEKLPYAYDALEPYIDAQTMELHYSKHHNGYFNKLQNAAKGTEVENMTLNDVFKNISKYPKGIRNNGGGHFNHNLFWSVMGPDKGGQPSGKLMEAINKHFGSFDEFKEKFEKAALGRFGSGWAWLIVKDDKSIAITDTPNQDNPLMDVVDENGMPILGIDVWEHAYYLKYQNRRPEYVSAFWNVVNWEEVSRRYEELI
ncbi:MAG: superoxide dismutase [Bacteroidales bacterium]|nr:superoxide dismutase [Bacteroidales bacterium]MCF8327785.1 superoxide dismutase [Bacteroidales bacterium]